MVRPETPALLVEEDGVSIIERVIEGKGDVPDNYYVRHFEIG